jgi:hypothetical protein
VQRLAGLVEARLESGGRLGRYTMDQVAQHNTKDSGWVVVDGKVRGPGGAGDGVAHQQRRRRGRRA